MFNFSTTFQFQHRPLYIHGVDRNFLLWQRMYKWCWNCKINSLISNGRVVKAPLNFNVILYMMNTSLIFAGIMQMSDYFYPLPCGQVGRVPGTTVLLSWVTRFDPTRGNMKFSLVKTNNKVRLVFGVSRFKPESKFCHFVKFKKQDNKWKFKLMQVFQKKASDCQKPCGQVGRALGTTLLLSWVPGFDSTRDDIIFSFIENQDFP